MTDSTSDQRLLACGDYSDLFWSTSDGLEIVARQWTVPRAKGAVLLIHGMGDHSGRLEHVAEFLNQAGYSVLAPDLRGHGRSQGQRGHIRSFDVLLNDTALALEKTRNVAPHGPCFIYGQSMGGLLTLLFVMRRQPPIAGLIASSAALRVAMPPPAWKVALGTALRRTLPRISLNSGLDPQELSDDPQVATRLLSDRLRHQRITPEVYFGMLESGQWCLQNGDQLHCPALIMHGCQDRITDHRASLQFAEANQQCELALWQHGKHELHNMRDRQKILTRVTTFQNRCSRGDSPSTD